MNPPTGTVTFLFTDIEGSTRLWEEHPDAMRSALARHNTLVSQAISNAGGYVFKAAGDAFCAAFATAHDAVTAALSAQLLLHSEPWPECAVIRVRMALHTGAANQYPDGTDYFGPTLNRVARLLSAAHGGQALLSDITRDLCRDALPNGCSLKGLGEHRLKDLGRPENVFQLCHAGLQAEFPPLRSLKSLPTNLTQQLTSFIGREKELGEVKTMLGKTRLLTLTGSGGCGKTRLALQAAVDMLDAWLDGIWLVELAAIADPSLVPQEAAGALVLKEEPGKTILQMLIDHLKSKQMLLILDNCEHLLAACADLTDAILCICPQVTIIATSREGLGIAGEHTYRVPSMSVPDSAHTQTPESLSKSESARLFVERAAQGQPDFHVTPQNAAALASICRRLDGIPLAIELAAARVRTLSLEEINSKLDQRFRLLTGGSRTALPRQQTLRSLIDWSYVLLNEQEQRLMQRVSVFSGGWTLEAAESVCSGDGIEEWEVMDLLSSMVDKSLATVDLSGTVARYRLLETVRQYARDRLLESDHAYESRNRHLANYLALAERAAPNLNGPDQLEWLARLDSEYENLRAALEWSLDLADGGGMAVRMGAALWQYWNMQFRRSEGRAMLAAILATPAGSATSTASAVIAFGAGVLAWYQGDLAAAQTLTERSFKKFNELGDMAGVARTLNSLGNLNSSVGDYPAALNRHQGALRIRRTLGDLSGAAMSLNNLATIHVAQGNFRTAQTCLNESLAIIREHANPWLLAIALVNLGEIECELGNLQESRSYFAECLAKTLEQGWPGNPFLLENLAKLAIAEGRPEEAAGLFGAAERGREVAEMPLTPGQRERVEAKIITARAALGDDAVFDRAWANGRAMTLEQAAELALRKSEA